MCVSVEHVCLYVISVEFSAYLPYAAIVGDKNVFTRDEKFPSE